MAWTIEWDKQAVKEFKKMDRQVQRDIMKYLHKVLEADDPRYFGKELKGDKRGYWRYRIEDYRVVCQLEDERCVIFVVRAAHRRKVYN